MATIKDVAQEAGLAVSTVSRILNNRGYISENARKKVDEAMKKLNYQPNELARSLHRKNSNLIGLIVPHVRHPYFAEVISNIENQAFRKGYRILLCNSQTMEKREEDYIEICKSNRVAGIIMCTGRESLEGFENLGVPVIAWERFQDFGLASVEVDNVQGGILAGELLVKKGCKHILNLGTVHPVQMPGDFRYIGLKRVCDKYGVEVNSAISSLSNAYLDDYKQEVIDALKKYPQTDGVFANNDILAAYTIQACNELGISVPEQIKVVGFDDSLIARVSHPRITSIQQPIESMAELAVSVLDNALNGKPIASRSMFPVKLIEREST